MYKVGTGNVGNFMPFRVFKILFPQSTITKLLTTKYNTVMLNIQSIIEQLSVCTVKIRHKDKCPKCRFFVVPGDGQALLEMPDIEL